MSDKVNIKEKFTKIEEYFSPKIISSMDDYHIKLAKLKGEFIWHKHDNSDEVFILIKGILEIHFKDNVVNVKEGELIVIPKNVEHRPIAKKECHVLLIEKKVTINTGSINDDFTILDPDWI